MKRCRSIQRSCSLCSNANRFSGGFGSAVARRSFALRHVQNREHWAGDLMISEDAIGKLTMVASQNKIPLSCTCGAAHNPGRHRYGMCGWCVQALSVRSRAILFTHHTTVGDANSPSVARISCSLATRASRLCNLTALPKTVFSGWENGPANRNSG